MLHIYQTVLGAAFALSTLTANPAIAETEAAQNSGFTPSITLSLKNTYQGETYEFTSETWVFDENRCDHFDWMAAFGYISSVEMHDYAHAYTNMSADVTIRGRTGTVTYHDLSIGELGMLFANSHGFTGEAIRDHAADLLSDQCLVMS